MTFEQNLLSFALSQKDCHAKALANFLFREIIEDAHAKYKISQEDMKTMCKKAVNRAALFLSIKDDPELLRTFALYAIGGEEWDAAERTTEIEEVYNMLKELTN